MYEIHYGGKHMKDTKVKKLTLIAMMTAILCILAPLSIPISNVPISAATLIVSFAAIILGTKYSLICVSLYILLGIVGLPVFAGWGSGIGVIAGPTGGYLIGYFFIAFCTGFFLKLGKEKLTLLAVGMLLGTVACYTFGTVWLAYQLSLDTKAALMAGVIPFIPGDVIKIIVCLVVALPIRKLLKRNAMIVS